LGKCLCPISDVKRGNRYRHVSADKMVARSHLSVWMVNNDIDEL
jgi:hypothetical protein